MKILIKPIILCLLLLLLSITKGYAQTMLITLTDGATKTYSISSSSKIYFEQDNLIFAETQAATPVSSIHKITFNTPSGVNDINSDNVQISIFPNPATDFISVKNAPDETCQVNIFSATGMLMLSVNVNSSAEKINVSNLAKGIYLVKVKNITAKFIKL